MALSVITWNCQGIKMGSVATLLKRYSPDVLCLQECGDFDRDLDDNDIGETFVKEDFSGDFGLVHHPWMRPRPRGGTGNARVSLGVVYRRDKVKYSYTVGSRDPLKRPVIRMRDRASATYIYCIHAGGQDYIGEVVASANTWAKNWIICGDFNQRPQVVSALIDRSDVVVHSPVHVTRPASNSIIDYFLLRGINTANGFDRPRTLVRPYSGSDHCPVLGKFM